MPQRKPRSHCPISFALDLIGDKWSLLVLRDVIFFEKSRYQDFLNSSEGISTNILADRLNALEESGFLEKHNDPNNGRQYIYSPTKKALDLIPVMLELIRWSGRYDAETAAPKDFLKRLKLNREQLIKEILKRHKI